MKELPKVNRMEYLGLLSVCNCWRAAQKINLLGE